MQVVDVAEALPRMQALASRLWTPNARHHRPADADTVLGWATEVGGEVATVVLETETHLLDLLARGGFVVDDEASWFTHHLLDLRGLDAPTVPEGYTLRAVEPAEAEPRAACHRAAWSTSSKVTGAAYARLMQTPPYRLDLDWVAVDGDGRMVASALVWLDAGTGVALVEPVGCRPEHRGHGLAGAVSMAALRAAARAGARVGLVCPRGDDAYPVPQRLYRRLGFKPHARTVLLRRPDPGSRV